MGVQQERQPTATAVATEQELLERLREEDEEDKQKEIKTEKEREKKKKRHFLASLPSSPKKRSKNSILRGQVVMRVHRNNPISSAPLPEDMEETSHSQVPLEMGCHA